MQPRRVRYRRVVVYEPASHESVRAQAVIPYFDAAFEGEGVGTYWVPVTLSGFGGFGKQWQAQKLAQSVAQAIAREYAMRRGLES
jgi:hypothetical protein